jgi:hypothetical protein
VLGRASEVGVKGTAHAGERFKDGRGPKFFKGRSLRSLKVSALVAPSESCRPFRRRKVMFAGT